MGYHLNCLDEPVLIAVSKPLRTEFGIHRRLESCGRYLRLKYEMANFFLLLCHKPSDDTNEATPTTFHLPVVGSCQVRGPKILNCVFSSLIFFVNGMYDIFTNMTP